MHHPDNWSDPGTPIFHRKGKAFRWKNKNKNKNKNNNYYHYHCGAETFNPDREQWKVEEGKWPAPMTFVPFGAGPRSCIGEEMARKEIKMGTSWELSISQKSVRPRLTNARTTAHAPPHTTM
jgi:hypothetical protein